MPLGKLLWSILGEAALHRSATVHALLLPATNDMERMDKGVLSAPPGGFCPLCHGNKPLERVSEEGCCCYDYTQPEGDQQHQLSVKVTHHPRSPLTAAAAL